MDGLVILKDFLESHRIPKGSPKGTPYNFVSLPKSTGIFRRGTFCIPESKRGDFWKYYSDAVPFFNEKNCPSLAYRPPIRTMQPLQIDVDFYFRHETKLDPSVNFKFTVNIATKIANICKQSVNFYIVSKKSGYFKYSEKEKINKYKNGFHIYFSNIRIPKRVARDIKKYAEGIVQEYYRDLQPTNEPADIIDGCVVERSNGLMLIGTFKSANTGGRYLLRLMGSVDEDGTICEAEMNKEKVFEQLESILNNTYNFVWEIPQEEDEKTEKSSEPPTKKRKTHHVVNERIPFNVAKFLEVTSNHRPSHKEWLQIVFYCASIGVPRDQMSLLGGRNNSCPYQVYDSRQPGKDAISRGSIIRYLNAYATDYVTPEIFREIFPERVFQYLSEYTDFLFSTGVTWDKQILKNFLMDTISFIMKCKKFVYKDYENEQDDHGNETRRITTFIQDKPPFSNTEDIIVMIPYEIDALKKIIQSKKNKIKKNDDGERALRLRLSYAKYMKMLENPTSSGVRQITKELGLPPNQVHMSTILTDLNLKGFIKRYKSITFKPYLWVDKSGVGTFNTFNPFYLLEYNPTKIIDWTTTALYEFFFRAYSWSEQSKFDGLMNLLAFWVQNPSTRDERIIILLSEAHGIGKSTLAEILVKLFGEELVIFFNSFKTFDSTFNLALANKLIWFIDDTRNISRGSAQSLNSLATQKVMRFNEKNEKSFYLPICNSIILTSNDINPLYCSAEDRRQMYIRVKPCFKNNREFFARVHACMDDYNVMHNFFMYLANRNLEKWTPSPTNDCFQNETNKQKQMAMRSSYIFIVEFFSEPDWFSKYRPFNERDWRKGFQVGTYDRGLYNNKNHIRIRADQLFDLFKSWNKDKNPGSKTVRERTFFLHLSKLGIEKKPKQYIQTVQRTCCDLVYIGIRSRLKRLFPGFKMPNWPTENPNELRRIKIALGQKVSEFPDCEETEFLDENQPKLKF